MNATHVASLDLFPLLPQTWLWPLIAAAIALTALSLWKNRRAVIWRTLCLTLFILFLLGPSWLEETRKPVTDVAAILVDDSPSQNIAGRKERTEKALAYLQSELENREGLELRVIRAPVRTEKIAEETRVFEALDLALSDIPQARRAGLFIISDGQIHDVPQTAPDRQQEYGPVHLLLTGDKNERDRHLKITQAPSFGIVDETLSIKFIVEDTGNTARQTANVTVTDAQGRRNVMTVPVGEEQTIDFTVEHAGQNVFELAADNLPDELTLANNKAALLVNGVRDRLRVLLVSGQPHAGGRTWRDLLTSDPSVDLVHFTILREPEKLDRTPQDEMSLIAFPFRELFEIKLYDFDLIIFDRYRLNSVVPDRYFKNISTFVEQGGALLAASGPDYATERSLYTTSLAAVLPSSPTGDVFHEPFIPAVTDHGKFHPVTRGLHPAAGQAEEGKSWSPWLRQVDIIPEPGTDIVMKGVQDKPLLVLERMGEGRAAQFASDHIWLWSRGYQGGGPSAELLRRVVHWLMKEPELDERALDVRVDETTLTIRAANFNNPTRNITVTTPEGDTKSLTMEENEDGWLQATFRADSLGVHTFETESGQKRYAVVGNLNPPELNEVRATQEKINPLLETSGGGAVWLSENPSPGIRAISQSQRNYAGRNWLGIRRNNEYNVTGVENTPLLPFWLMLVILISSALWMWWREGRS